jgi:hypothetical protein
VKDSSGEPYTYFDNQDTEIKFRDAGTYEVRIRRMPVPLTDLAQTPEVHPLFHNALTFYVRGWWKMKDDDENQDGLAQIARFEQSASKAFTILARKRGPKQMAVIRHA